MVGKAAGLDLILANVDGTDGEIRLFDGANVSGGNLTLSLGGFGGTTRSLRLSNQTWQFTDFDGSWLNMKPDRLGPNTHNAIAINTGSVSTWYEGIFALESPTLSLAIQSAADVHLFSNAYLDASATYLYKGTGPAVDYYESAGTHVWSVAPSGTAGSAITWTQAMKLANDGSLYINVSGTLKQVTFGASDSCGTGFKCLKIAN
jgi:hypothetical protein